MNTRDDPIAVILVALLLLAILLGLLATAVYFTNPPAPRSPKVVVIYGSECGAAQPTRISLGDYDER